ncbi:MAG TPA: DNA polymerase III subunit delta [Lentimicrobium sp.]|jgi:DNA polymerase-3 subunit delta|nr:DNA polymerase III subunit delta [Lentimicrobium sp.]
MAADHNRILADIGKKIFHPVYLLHGEEPYYIDLISDALENNVLSDIEKEFNLSVLYGRDVDARAIADQCKRYPMMASHQVVIIKEGQDVKSYDDLIPYIGNPLNSTLLVICYKYRKFDKRKQFYKLIEKKGICFESGRIYEEKVPAWINSQVAAAGYGINTKASSMIADALGSDLSKISNELSKLYINIPKGSEINEKHVEENIGISKDYNFFELQKAIAARDILKANRITMYFASNPKDNPLVKNVILLFSFFSKLLVFQTMKGKPDGEVAAALGMTSSYFLSDYKTASRHYSLAKIADIIGLLRQYDLKSKGLDSGSTSEGELIRELIYKILH